MQTALFCPDRVRAQVGDRRRTKDEETCSWSRKVDKTHIKERDRAEKAVRSLRSFKVLPWRSTCSWLWTKLKLVLSHTQVLRATTSKTLCTYTSRTRRNVACSSSRISSRCERQNKQHFAVGKKGEKKKNYEMVYTQEPFKEIMQYIPAREST